MQQIDPISRQTTTNSDANDSLSVGPRLLRSDHASVSVGTGFSRFRACQRFVNAIRTHGCRRERPSATWKSPHRYPEQVERSLAQTSADIDHFSHIPKVAGSHPAPATNESPGRSQDLPGLLSLPEARLSTRCQREPVRSCEIPLILRVADATGADGERPVRTRAQVVRIRAGEQPRRSRLAMGCSMRSVAAAEIDFSVLRIVGCMFGRSWSGIFLVFAG